MKRTLTGIFGFILLGLLAHSVKDADVNIDDVYGKKPIVGYLKVPVGTVVNVTGDVYVQTNSSRVADMFMHTNSASAEYFIRIRKVNTNDVNGVVTLKLVPSPLQKSENIPIGDNLKIRIYETCGYMGVPEALHGKERWTDWNYRFAIWGVFVGLP